MTRHHAHAGERRPSAPRPAAEQLAGTMFDARPIAVAPRDIRLDPPSAAGSDSSERGAAAVKRKSQSQMDGILVILATLPEGACLSRDEIISRFGRGAHALTVNAACGRLNTLVETLQQVDVVENGAVSHAGNRVNGYRLSEKGRARIVDSTRRSA